MNRGRAEKKRLSMEQEMEAREAALQQKVMAASRKLTSLEKTPESVGR